MRESEIVAKYGKDFAEKIFNDTYMQCITITMYPDGETNIPESDVLRAVRHIKGEKISSFEWDWNE